MIIKKWCALFKDAKEILNEESEINLAYLYGNKSKIIGSRNKKNYSKTIQWIIAVLFALRNTTLLKKNDGKEYDIYAYAASKNQIAVIAPTFNEISNSRRSCILEVKENYLKHLKLNRKTFNSKFLMQDLLLGGIIGLSRRKELKKIINESDINLIPYLHIFVRSYFYIAYFIRRLKETKSKFILISNDHNIDARSLMAAARKIGVKSIYMQHASVSNHFPALRFDYAFLDGHIALKYYNECEKNYPGSNPKYPTPTIFLSGQKKIINSSPKESKNNYVGLAINKLDDIDEVINIVKKIARQNINLIVRWHPGQNRTKINPIIEIKKLHPSVMFSDPKIEAIEDYLSKTQIVIAGNSSILLESALAGVIPIYFEINKQIKKDVYGYVENGLAQQATNIDELISIIHELKEKKYFVNPAKIKLYSASHQTEWQGREFILTAKTIERLDDKLAISNLYNQIKLDEIPWEIHEAK